MIERRAIARYANALFGLAQKSGQMDAVDRELEAAAQLTAQHPEIPHLLRNSTISIAEKEDFIEKILPAGTSKLTVNFIKVLTRKKRFGELTAIQKKFRSLLEKKKGIQEVECISAAPLSADVEQKLKAVLSKKLKAEIRLTSEVDPEILGGFILRFDGREINSSYQSRLEELKQMLSS